MGCSASNENSSFHSKPPSFDPPITEVHMLENELNLVLNKGLNKEQKKIIIEKLKLCDNSYSVQMNKNKDCIRIKGPVLKMWQYLGEHNMCGLYVTL